ncbi:uncharacterized protein LOC118301910 [Scophthalmus maximus]|uniref:uncharacterized protein LOC118301910 n=1 Tax=Scophthalmus maximus TaxID=52904 RepID=UPI001FA8F595|nr:uncharacterized protein LOC118301910 [Scophthalmus maximus]XP_047185131.1 uncharacterized protein LOC118301910 [Scophthalmus maximus]XP_047185132.1 uncharacterized protein LOC118301910 [Scophthalmus maximus]XP_047185133.1 uncharacterized protein LOC118301910 [Scophthalmus maximus]
METASLLLSNSMEGRHGQEESVKVLATIFKNGNELKRKSQSTTELLEKTSELGLVLDRILKFNTDFQEFTDVESSVQISNLDRFQVHFSEAPHLQTVPREVCQTQPTQVPDLQAGLRPLLEMKVPEIFDELQTKGIVTEKTRLKLVKVCISDLVEKHGFYPSTTEKVVLAKNIITIFPSLKVQIDGRGEGFEHFFDPASRSGFLEMRLRNIHRKLEEGQRRYSRHKRSRDVNEMSNSVQDEGDSSDVREFINLMKRLRPSAENISSIKSAMQKTFTWRRSWISKHSPTMEEILQEYPRFLDIPTLLDTEFGKMHEGKGDLFLRRWEASIMPKLKAVAASEKGDVASLVEGMEDQSDDENCYMMLVVLTHLLPPIAASRCSVKSAIKRLVDFVPVCLFGILS